MNTFVNTYSAFGFTFRSPLELPGFQPEQTSPDASVMIQFGNVPESLPHPVKRGVAYEAAPETLLLKVPGIGRYLVRGGREIVISPAPEATDAELRLFLMGSAFGALLQQRNILPLHAGAIQIGNACVAIAGKSGVGKSTLCGFLQQRGYTTVADDVCPVTVSSDQRALVHPGFPRLKLWADSLCALGIESQGLVQCRPELEKFELLTAPLLSNNCLPLTRIYLLYEARGNEREGIEPVQGPERLRVLLQNTYRFRFLEGLGLKEHHLRMCAALLGTVSVFRFRRHHEISRAAEMADLLEQDLHRCFDSSSMGHSSG